MSFKNRTIHMKFWSNLCKILIVSYILFMYFYQSKVAGRPLTAEEGKGLLWIGLCCFAILSPVDISIILTSLEKAKASAAGIRQASSTYHITDKAVDVEHKDEG